MRLKKSFEIISELLEHYDYDAANAPVVKRCIHTSADFDYAKNLYFSPNVLAIFKTLFKNGCRIVTDTQMAKAGINKRLAESFGIKTKCFIADEDTVLAALERGVTCAIVAVEKALCLDEPTVFAVGNAPTALIRLCDAISRGYRPAGVIAAAICNAVMREM